MKQFRKFDLDGDGTISHDELAQVLKDCDTSHWGEENITKLFEAIDTNKDGNIELHEFVDWALNGHEMDLELPAKRPLWDAFAEALAMSNLLQKAAKGVSAAEYIRGLRNQFHLGDVPRGLDGRVSMLHVSRGMTSGDYSYSLKTLAPDGNGCVLLLLEESGSEGNKQHIYCLGPGDTLGFVETAAGKAGPSPGGEVFSAAWAKLPPEMKLVGLFALSKGGGENISISAAIELLPEAIERNILSTAQALALREICGKHALIALAKRLLRQGIEDGDIPAFQDAEVEEKQLDQLTQLPLEELEECVGMEFDDACCEALSFLGEDRSWHVNDLVGQIFATAAASAIND